MSIAGVLHVVLSLNPGGTERLVVEMAKRTAKERPTAVCCLDEAGCWAGELTALGIRVAVLGRRPGFQLSLGRELAALAAQERADVLHCHQYSPFVYGRLALLWHRGARLIYTEHGRLSDEAPSLKRRLVNHVIGRFRGRIIAVSVELRDYLIASGFRPSRVGVVYNGIDPGQPASAESRRRARLALRLSEDALVVGTVARLDPVKDLTTLVRAVSIKSDARPRPTLVIVGDGPVRHSVESLVAQLSLGETVRLLGHRSDVRELLPAFDVYANSSISEGVSVTILEAMAAGLPVVATRVGGTPEVVIDGETGLLVPPRAPTALGQAIASLASEPGRRLGLGQEGRRRVQHCFSLDRMVTDYANAYEGGQSLQDN